MMVMMIDDGTFGRHLFLFFLSALFSDEQQLQKMSFQSHHQQNHDEYMTEEELAEFLNGVENTITKPEIERMYLSRRRLSIELVQNKSNHLMTKQQQQQHTCQDLLESNNCIVCVLVLVLDDCINSCLLECISIQGGTIRRWYDFPFH
jgi:hypothetical protein